MGNTCCSSNTYENNSEIIFLYHATDIHTLWFTPHFFFKKKYYMIDRAEKRKIEKIAIDYLKYVGEEQFMTDRNSKSLKYILNHEWYKKFNNACLV